MKTTKLALCLICLIIFNLQFFSAETKNSYEQTREDWLPRLKEIFGDKQPSVKQSDTIHNARELKYPGQRFMHMGVVQIDGKGQLVKRHKYWFDTGKFYQLQHQSDFTILEEITSTDAELNDGIIKSHFKVQCFNEQLISAKVGYNFGVVKSNDIIKALKTFRNNNGCLIIELGDKLIKASAIKAAAPGQLGSAAGMFGTGVLLKTAEWVLGKLDGNTDDEGNVILSREAIEKLYPGADKMIRKLHHLEGTVITTRWVAQDGKRTPNEIGYQEMHIKCPNNRNITEEDKEMLAKMIYRANPFGVKTILPDDKKGAGNVWEIDADDVTPWLATAGVNFDYVDGIIRVRDNGSSKSSEYEDENALQNKEEIAVTTLRAITKNNDRLRFMKTMKDNSQVKMSIIPTSGTIVVVTPEKTEDVPNYVKSIDMDGRIVSHIDKSTGLLRDINYEKNSIKMKFAYTQMRMPVKVENKTTQK